jgi:hypothetical protein
LASGCLLPLKTGSESSWQWVQSLRLEGEISKDPEGAETAASLSKEANGLPSQTQECGPMMGIAEIETGGISAMFW